MRKLDKINTAQLIDLVVLFCSGICHAKFITGFDTWPQLVWHLLQWLPLLTGAICFFNYGILFQIDRVMHSPFGNFGIASAAFVAPGLGYVIGYHLI